LKASIQERQAHGGEARPHERMSEGVDGLDFWSEGGGLYQTRRGVCLPSRRRYEDELEGYGGVSKRGRTIRDSFGRKLYSYKGARGTCARGAWGGASIHFC